MIKEGEYIKHDYSVYAKVEGKIYKFYFGFIEDESTRTKKGKFLRTYEDVIEIPMIGKYIISGYSKAYRLDNCFIIDKIPVEVYMEVLK